MPIAITTNNGSTTAEASKQPTQWVTFASAGSGFQVAVDISTSFRQICRFGVLPSMFLRKVIRSIGPQIENGVSKSASKERPEKLKLPQLGGGRDNPPSNRGNSPMRPFLITVLLLVGSNVFMTFAGMHTRRISPSNPLLVGILGQSGHRARSKESPAVLVRSHLAPPDDVAAGRKCCKR